MLDFPKIIQTSKFASDANKMEIVYVSVERNASWTERTEIAHRDLKRLFDNCLQRDS